VAAGDRLEHRAIRGDELASFCTVTREDQILVVTMNRPEKRNSLPPESHPEMERIWDEFVADPGLRVGILTGAGDKAFCAGSDLSGYQAGYDGTLPPTGGGGLTHRLDRRKPVIAAVNGFALGGGCELAMACTLRIAADTARFGQPEINLGLIPGFAGTQRLARLVGKAKAMELILTGNPIPASEALAIGLVNRVVPAANLMSEARALAAELAAKPAIALRYAMEAINSGLEMPFVEACRLEASLFGMLTATDDMKEGTRAFLEKRKPEFKG